MLTSVPWSQHLFLRAQEAFRWIYSSELRHGISAPYHLILTESISEDLTERLMPLTPAQYHAHMLQSIIVNALSDTTDTKYTRHWSRIVVLRFVWKQAAALAWVHLGTSGMRSPSVLKDRQPISPGASPVLTH